MVIGGTAAVFHATRIIAPNLWALLVQKKPTKHMAIIRFGCFAAAVSSVGLMGNWGLASIFGVVLLFSFFWSAVLPQFEVLTLSHLGDARAVDYGRIRLWGAVGFLLAVILLGGLFQQVNYGWFPLVLFLLLMGLVVVSLMAPSAPMAPDQLAAQTFLAVLLRPAVLTFLGVVVLVQISFGSYYGFFSLLLASLGYSPTQIGLLWGLGVLAEIVVFSQMRPLFKRFGLRALLGFSVATALVRWLLLGQFASLLPVLIFSQLLHAFAFGALHACIIEQVRHFFRDAGHVRGQALFNSLGYGLGAVIGALAAGYLWDILGAGIFMVSAAVSFVALIVLQRFFVMEGHN